MSQQPILNMLIMDFGMQIEELSFSMGLPDVLARKSDLKRRTKNELRLAVL